MDDIRIEQLQLFDDFSSRFRGIESVIPPYSRFERLRSDIAAVGAADPQRITRGSAAEQDMILYMIRGQQFADPDTDLTRASGPAGGVDLYDLHQT